MDADKLEEGASAEAAEVKPAASWVHHQNLEGPSLSSDVSRTDVDDN